MLLPEQRALLVTYCNDHPVAVCPQCSEALTFERIGADIIMGKRDFCPICRADLTAAVLTHLSECTVLRVQRRDAGKRAPETSRPGHQPGEGPGDDRQGTADLPRLHTDPEQPPAGVETGRSTGGGQAG
jgi:hypothetical protein